MCRLNLGLYSHPKEVFFGRRGGGGGGLESEPMLTPREKSPLPEKIHLRGGSNQRRCMKQNSQPNTQPAELLQPPKRGSILGPPLWRRTL